MHRGWRRGGHISVKLKTQEGHTNNIFLTASDEEVVVDFVKDDEELYDKTSKLLRDKARNECCQQSQAVCQGVQNWAVLKRTDSSPEKD